MAKSWKQTVLLVIGGGVFAIGAFVAGLFLYVNATARPLHPDASAMPTVTESAAPPKWSAAVEHARPQVRARVIAQNLPGASVAVGVGGDIVWAEGFGYADLEKQTPVRPETRFRTGEVSMALTSAAVGLLLENDRLNLESEIQAYVPAFPEQQWPVTLRQLMGHTAGITTDQGDEAPIGEHCDRTGDGLRLFADNPLRFEPGTEQRYSTFGWILVSAAVEAAAKEPFFSFMRTKIFEPLGMRDTMPDSAKEPIPDRTTFYFPRFAGDPRYGPELAREGDHSCWAGASAFLSTPSDLVRFGMAVTGGTLLQRATVKTLQTSQRLASGAETGYGLGWTLETVQLAGEATRMAGHGTKADLIGGTASLMTFPERGLVVAVMTNTAFGDTKAIALDIAEAFAAQGKRPAS